MHEERACKLLGFVEFWKMRLRYFIEIPSHGRISYDCHAASTVSPQIKPSYSFQKLLQNIRQFKSPLEKLRVPSNFRIPNSLSRENIPENAILLCEIPRENGCVRKMVLCLHSLGCLYRRQLAKKGQSLQFEQDPR